MAIFQQGLFQIDAKDTPQSIARKRAIVAQIMGSNSAPKTIGEGLNALGDGIVANVLNRRADAAEQTGQASANDIQTRFANWISGRNTFPDAPSSVSADATGDVASNRVAQAFGDSAQDAHASEHDRDPSIAGLQIKGGIQETAKSLGIDPVDLATAISYETGGTFDPTKAGPTTKWGQHKGLIQFGEPQAKQYGVDWNNPVGSQLGADGAVAKYLRDTGVKPGMGMLDIYSAINAGGVGRYGASDAAAGGAPGTVADKVNSQMAGHRAKALAMFGGGGQPAASAAPVQVASLDPSAGMPSAIPPVPEEYARTGLSQAAWERMNAPNGAVPPVQPAPTPGPANVPVTGGKGDRVSMAQTAAVSMQPGPIPNANPVQAAFIDRMTNPQSMTGGSPMPLQGMPQPAPKQVAQAEPDLSRVPVTAGGTAGARQAGDAPPVDMGLLMQVMSNPFVDENTKAFAANMIEQQMKSQDPANQLDMEYRKAQLDALKNPVEKPTDDMREYDLARKQGYEGTFQQYQLDMRKAGATNVNVGGEPSDGALRKKLDEKTGELWSSYQQTGATSAATAQDMQVLDELIKVAPQGPITGRLAEMLPGISSAGDAFQSIVKRVAPTLRAPGSGSTSDIEYDGMLRSLPALRNRPEANVAISQIMKSKAAINIERSGIVDAYGRGEISAGEARSKIAELDKRSILTPELSQAIGDLGGEGGGPMQGTVVDGYRFKGGDPADPNSWEQVQ